MKHCQITGVEMPDEINLENHACNTGDCDHYHQKDCDKTLAAYRDAQACDSSAEFPEADFDNWYAGFTCTRNRYATPNEAARWGFERGRTIIAWDVVTEPLTDKIADLEAKLAEAQDDLKRAKHEVECQKKTVLTLYDHIHEKHDRLEVAQAEIERLKEKYERT